MNASPASSIVGRLSIGISRVSIRHGHATPRFRPARPELTGFEPGHGERIWVFNNIESNQVIYSHGPAMDSNRALRQIPFNGKKLKPAKLRKDYWKPMALIQFPVGLGVVGQSVFQKLREFKRLHELTWGYQTSDIILKNKKKERGIALNDQKANAVADIAAVLGGAGRGNRMWTTEQSTDNLIKGQELESEKSLVETTIYWASELDREFARSWPANVTHALGLPERTSISTMEATNEAIASEAPQPNEETTVTA